MNKNDKRKRQYIKLIMGLLFFIIALAHLDCGKLAELLQNVNAWIVLLALIITISHIFVMVTIRTYLVNTFGTIKFAAILKTFFSTTYLSNILPAKAGAMLGEPWGLYSFSKGKIKFNDAFAFCLVISSSQNIRKIILTVIGLALFFRLLPEYYTAMIIVAVMLYAGYTATIMSAVFSSDKLLFLIEKFRNTIPKRIISLLTAISDVGQQTASGIKRFLKTKPRVPAGILVLLVITTMFESLRIWILLRAFGVEFNFFYLLLIPSLAYSVTALPVSPGGFGITEVSGLLVFKAFGIAPEIALSTVFLDRALSTYWTFLVGALLVPFIKIPSKDDFLSIKNHQNNEG